MTSNLSGVTYCFCRDKTVVVHQHWSRASRKRSFPAIISWEPFPYYPMEVHWDSTGSSSLSKKPA